MGEPTLQELKEGLDMVRTRVEEVHLAIVGNEPLGIVGMADRQRKLSEQLATLQGEHEEQMKAGGCGKDDGPISAKGWRVPWPVVKALALAAIAVLLGFGGGKIGSDSAAKAIQAAVVQAVSTALQQERN